MSDDSEYNPRPVSALLRSLPEHLSPRARLTYLIFWEDADRRYGPSDLSASAAMRLTHLSWNAQQNAIRELRAAGLLSEAQRYPSAPDLWFRWVMPPKPDAEARV
jgi:hypothetical protein